jgi:hypothetical protein
MSTKAGWKASHGPFSIFKVAWGRRETRKLVVSSQRKHEKLNRSLGVTVHSSPMLTCCAFQYICCELSIVPLRFGVKANFYF